VHQLRRRRSQQFFRLVAEDALVPFAQVGIAPQRIEFADEFVVVGDDPLQLVFAVLQFLGGPFPVRNVPGEGLYDALSLPADHLGADFRRYEPSILRPIQRFEHQGIDLPQGLQLLSYCGGPVFALDHPKIFSQEFVPGESEQPARIVVQVDDRPFEVVDDQGVVHVLHDGSIMFLRLV